MNISILENKKKMNFFNLKGGMNDSLSLNEKFQNEPLNKLITNFEEVENFLKTGKDKIFQFLYFIWRVFNDILYNNDKLIDLDEFKIENDKLSELFYLDLILMYNTGISNFEYSLEFIKNINEIGKNNSKQEYKQLIYSKIIFDLINNFQDEAEIEEDSLNEIKDFNNKIIEDNLINFNF